MKNWILIAIVMGLALRSSAQYAEILKPQPAELVALYKKNHVSFVNYSERKQGKDTLVSISAVDSSGYILIKRETKNIHYFDYNANGDLENRLDSVKMMGKIFRYSYSAGYQGHGLLYSLELPTGTSVFVYDELKHTLNENFLPTGAKFFCKNIYKYDDAYRLVYEELRDSIGRPYKDHSYTYDKSSKLAKEEINEYFKGNTKNYLGYIYTYNAAGKISGMQINVVENYGTADDETGVKHNARFNTISESYTYDKAGNMVKKIHADAKNPKVNYTMNMEYYENGLLGVEQTVNKKGVITSLMTYKYEYYGK